MDLSLCISLVMMLNGGQNVNKDLLATTAKGVRKENHLGLC